MDDNSGGKLSGVEMMLRTVLRALGVKPDEVMAAIERFRVALPEFAARADKRLESIDGRLAAIESKLQIPPPFDIEAERLPAEQVNGR